MRYIALIWFAFAALTTLNLHAVKICGLSPTWALVLTLGQCVGGLGVATAYLFFAEEVVTRFHGVKSWYRGRFCN